MAVEGCLSNMWLACSGAVSSPDVQRGMICDSQILFVELWIVLHNAKLSVVSLHNNLWALL